MPVLTPALESASWARRVLALFVDWVASTLTVIAVVGLDAYSEPGSNAQFLVLGVYVVESAAFTWLLGGSFGKLVTRLRVVPDDGSGRSVGLIGALVRTVLVALLVPPLVFRPDGRGLHDLAARTRTITV